MRKPPRHVAIIMDGNGRWAESRGLPRQHGHKAGAKVVQPLVEAAARLGIDYLTLYAFSTENWKRPQVEISTLMNLLRKFLTEQLPAMQRNGVRFNTIGQTEKLPLPARTVISRVRKATADNTKITLTLALSYGGRAEITDAVRKLACKVQNGEISPDDISEETISAHLYTVDMPDPDLVIRTSGEMRLSNFLLWQAAYAELWITPTLWPDFTPEEFTGAIADYRNRNRRFGGINNA